MKLLPDCTFLAARICTRTQSKLYLIGGENFDPYSSSIGGYAVEFRSGSLVRDPISAPIAFKEDAALVSAYGNLYLITDGTCFESLIPDPSFEKYCPAMDKWVPMPSFPFYSHVSSMNIIGYAVCHGVILFSFRNPRKDSKIFAFHESRSKWSEVKVDDPDGVAFWGRAVIVDEIFYALSALQLEDEILAFSFKIDLDDKGNVEYFISSLFSLRAEFRGIPPTPSVIEPWKTECFVHLGNKEFIYIRTILTRTTSHRQSFHIAKFEIVDGGGHEKIKNLGQVVDDVELRSFLPWIDFGFVQGCKDVEPEEDERMAALLEEARLKKLSRQKMRKGKSVGAQKLRKDKPRWI